MSFDNLNPVAGRLADGAVISYVREGQGQPLVFIHGAMGDFRSWAPQWEAFTQHFDCIAISARFSYPNPNTMEAPDHSAVADAADVVALLDTLGIDRAIFVGSSYGGYASLAAAVNHSARVKALVAVEPPMMKYAQMFEDTAPAAAAFLDKTAIPAREAFERGDDLEGAMLLTGGIANKSLDDIPAAQLERRRQNLLAGRRIAMSSDEFPLLPPEALGAIAVPAMLVTGANTGPVFKAIIKGITRAMPQARLEVVEGAGHSVPQDQPDKFNRLALEFLKGAA